MDELKIKQGVLDTLKKLNQSWTLKGDIEELGKYFHDNIVVIEPGNRERKVGKDECLQGWKSFIEENKINYWKESDHLVQLYDEGKVAIVTYYWEISCKNAGQNFVSKGRDMFTFVNEHGKWLAVSDHFSSDPN